MASKYVFRFKDIENNSYIGRFSSSLYNGEEVDIEGSCTLEQDLSGNIWQPIQAKSCNVILNANTSQTLSDIYNEDSKYWLFRLSKNGRIIFQGYADTEGMEQAYDADEWQLNFSCRGHLSYLESVGYYDELGQPYEGLANLRTVILRCLNKGFNLESERLGIRLMHRLTVNEFDLYSNAYLDQSQFYDEDGEAEDCKKILEDLLLSIGCFIVQHELHFWVIPVPVWIRSYLVDIEFGDYNADNTYQGQVTLTPDATQRVIGEQINNYETHFEGSPSFVMKPYLQAQRVRHEFEYAPQVLRNGDLIADGGTMPYWTLGADATIVGDTVEIDGKELVSERTTALSSFTVPFRQGDKLEFSLNIEYVDNPTQHDILLELSGTNDYVYAFKTSTPEDNFNPTWRELPTGALLSQELRIVPDEEGVKELTFSLLELPEDGDLTVRITTPIFGSNHTASSKCIVNSVTLKGASQPFEAQEFTATRSDKKTGFIPEVLDIRFNTSGFYGDLLINSFKDVNGQNLEGFYDTVTNGTDENGMWLARQYVDLSSVNYPVFTTDIYNHNGFFTKLIRNFPFSFIITNEVKDLKENVSSMELTAVSLDTNEKTVETARIYKESIKPIIKS